RPPRQVLAPVNTSSGPVTSRLCTWSNRTIRTVRMRPSLTGPGHGSNDEYPNFPAIGLGAPGRPERHETPDPRRSDAVKTRFQCVQRAAVPAGGPFRRAGRSGGRAVRAGGGPAGGRVPVVPLT